MTSATDNPPVTLAALMESAGSVTTPLDAAADYWRAGVATLLPMYVLAMLPHAILSGLLIGTITSGQRTLAAQYCIYLTLATLWRWTWIAKLQQIVQQDLRSQAVAVFWRRVPSILLVRLLACVGLTWGIVLACVPAYYGLFVGSFAAPLLLESDDASLRRVRLSIRWIHHSGKRLFRILLSMICIIGLLIVATFASQFVLARTVLPTLLGIDTTELNLTLDSWAWRLSLFYFVYLLVDGFWSVAAVMVYYDSQSRRTATDLQARLKVLTESDS